MVGGANGGSEIRLNGPEIVSVEDKGLIRQSFLTYERRTTERMPVFASTSPRLLQIIMKSVERLTIGGGVRLPVSCSIVGRKVSGHVSRQTCDVQTLSGFSEFGMRPFHTKTVSLSC